MGCSSFRLRWGFLFPLLSSLAQWALVISILVMGVYSAVCIQLPSLTQVGTSYLAPVRVYILSPGLLTHTVGFPITLLTSLAQWALVVSILLSGVYIQLSVSSCLV